MLLGEHKGDRLIAPIGKIVIGEPPTKLVALALGSCVGTIIYDPILKVAALAHVALPSVATFKRKKNPT